MAKTPIKRAITGSLVVVNIESATSDPIFLIADDIPLIPTRKTYRALIMPKILRPMFFDSVFTDSFQFMFFKYWRE